jgi:hypothetical protein
MRMDFPHRAAPATIAPIPTASNGSCPPHKFRNHERHADPRSEASRCASSPSYRDCHSPVIRHKSRLKGSTLQVRICRKKAARGDTGRTTALDSARDPA